MEITREQVIDFLSNLTVMDIAALTKDLESKWGVKAAPVVTGGGGGKQEEQKTAPAKTEFPVWLTGLSDDTKKMPVLKLIRELTGLGLKEAKEFVENTPREVKVCGSQAEADEMKTRLAEAGGNVEIR